MLVLLSSEKANLPNVSNFALDFEGSLLRFRPWIFMGSEHMPKKTGSITHSKGVIAGSKWSFQWIGLRDNLQDPPTPYFIGNQLFPVDCPLEKFQWSLFSYFILSSISLSPKWLISKEPGKSGDFCWTIQKMVSLFHRVCLIDSNNISMSSNFSQVFPYISHFLRSFPFTLTL